MGFSLSGIQAYGMGGIQPLRYSVKNESQYSDSYYESVSSQGITGNSVKAAPPVIYPNAKTYEAGSVQGKRDNSAEAKFNEIASGYSGAVTGYGSNGNAQGYQVVGSNIDLYV